MSPEELAELKEVCAAVAPMSEGGTEFAYLPGLKILTVQGVVVRDALLSLGPHTGYTSRLYLSAAISSSKAANWTVHTVLGKAWHTPSWNNVVKSRPIEMLLQHLKAYK